MNGIMKPDFNNAFVCCIIKGFSIIFTIIYFRSPKDILLYFILQLHE